MKREELIGCIAELRSGKRGFILPVQGAYSLLVSGDNLYRDIKFDSNTKEAILEGFSSLDNSRHMFQYDIVKIYKLTGLKIFNNREAPDTSIMDYLKDSAYATVIYKEEPARIEMTLAEIEAALGHKVKIVS